MAIYHDLTKIPFVNADSISVLAMAKKVDGVTESLLMQSSQPSMICDVNGAASNSDGTTIDTVIRIPRILLTHITITIRLSHLTLMLMKVNRHRPPQVSAIINSGKDRTEVKKTIRNNFCNENVIKTGVAIVSKSSCMEQEHVDNLNVDCTTALVTDYFLSCFTAKSRMKRG